LSEDLKNEEINAMREPERVYVVLRGEDLERLEMVCAMYGLSRASAMRMSLVAMCRELGLIKL